MSEIFLIAIGMKENDIQLIVKSVFHAKFDYQ